MHIAHVEDERKGGDFYLVIIRNLAGSPYAEVIQNPVRHLKIKQRAYMRKEIRIQATDRQIRDALQRSKSGRVSRRKAKKAA